MTQKLLFILSLFTITSYGQLDKNLLLNLHELPTIAAMNALTGSKKGDLVHNVEGNAIYVYNGTEWVPVRLEHTPYLVMVDAITVAANTTATIYIEGYDFDLQTQLELPGLTLNSYTVLSPALIEASITTGGSGYFDILVKNGAFVNTAWPNNEKNRIYVP